MGFTEKVTEPINIQKGKKGRKSQQIKSAIIKTLKEEKLSETTKDI